MDDRFIYYGENEPFGGDKSGLLVVQEFEEGRDIQNYKKQEGPIRIVEVSDLEDKMQDLVEERISGYIRVYNSG